MPSYAWRSLHLCHHPQSSVAGLFFWRHSSDVDQFHLQPNMPLPAWGHALLHWNGLDRPAALRWWRSLYCRLPKTRPVPQTINEVSRLLPGAMRAPLRQLPHGFRCRGLPGCSCVHDPEWLPGCSRLRGSWRLFIDSCIVENTMHTNILFFKSLPCKGKCNNCSIAIEFTWHSLGTPP